MCWIYGLVATHPTRPDCELQIIQEQQIETPEPRDGGPSSPPSPRPSAWGLGFVEGSASGDANLAPTVRHQRAPRPSSLRVRNRARDLSGRVVLSWLHSGSDAGVEDRPSGERIAQPMADEGSLAMVDVSVPRAAAVCRDVRSALRPQRLTPVSDGGRARRAPTSLARHIFQLLLERQEQMPSRSAVGTLRAAVWNVLRWSEQAGPADIARDDVVLNVLWRSRRSPSALTGCRIGAPLWVLERNEPRVCPVCSQVHADIPLAATPYRATVLASAPLTDEPWEPVSDNVAFSVTSDARFVVEQLQRMAS